MTLSKTVRHLLAIEGMARTEIEALLGRAAELDREAREGRLAPSLRGKVVANLFFDDSTRTRSSFELAAHSLGATVLNWTAKGSSQSKGETLLDTARTLAAMGPSALVVRHPSSGAPALIAAHVDCAVINAGDGTHEHPSQALLDAFTLQQRLGPLDGRTVAIVGDILHSRVARSNVHCLRALGARVIACGPPMMIPQGLEALGCTVTWDMDEAIDGVDAVMLLRVQLERQGESVFPSQREYAARYGLGEARAARLKRGALVLHPGPINRGVEIASGVADRDPSVVLEQVRNGVAVRRAILEACA